MNHHALHPRGAIALVVIGALLALVFALTAVPAQAAIFSNSGPITVPAVNGAGVRPANPYPSTITVSGLTGAITNVDVSLTSVSHAWPADVDVLLVGPFGQNVVLLADAGSGFPISNVNLAFDDAALTAVPTPIVSGTYRPTNLGAFNVLPPAPAGPYGTALSVFNGTVPIGTWSLFVLDDVASVDSGSIAGGWSLDITTNGPVISSFTPTTGPAGTQVVITGTNLTGATSVEFGGVAAGVFTVNSATQITATVPSGASSGPITVTTPNGHASSATNYQVSPAPTITSFAPAKGKVGRNVVIHGTEFTGTTALHFGGTPAAIFTVNSPTQITAKVPAGAGTGPISATNAGGTGTSTALFVVQHARRLSLVMSRTKAKGTLTATDGFTRVAAGVPVRLQRKSGSAWRTIGNDLTTAKGRYSLAGTFGSGRYRVLAPKVTLTSGDIALQALSPTIRR
jgi:hypothetical protein